MSVEDKALAIEALLEESGVFPPPGGVPPPGQSSNTRRSTSAPAATPRRSGPRCPPSCAGCASGTACSIGTPVRQVVPGRQAERVGTIAWTATSAPPHANKAAPHLGRRAGRQRALTYRELHREVCRFANVLKSLGVQKGGLRRHLYAHCPGAGHRDARVRPHRRPPHRVCGGFSAEALRDRMNDAQAKLLITADGGYRRGSVVPLKRAADEALAGPHHS